jgi:CheY-like chemotaxis protein
MPEGGALTVETARVTLGAESQRIDPDLVAGEYVVLRVTDTGNGMDEATLARVLDPFFTTKEVGKGTGLGLPMVYGFVKQSGGAIEIQSEPGRGTTVRLYFPHHVAPAAVEGPAGQETQPLLGGSETILVVEDEPTVQAIAVEMLQEAGYHVLKAANAEEALSVVARYDGTVDMVLTDVVMPGMSGVLLAEQLRRRRPGLGVLYFSGYPGNKLIARGVNESMTVVTKPFTGESLMAQVRHTLDASKAASGT